MRTTLLKGLGTLAFAFGIGGLVPGTVFAETPLNPTFSKHVAPIFQAKCETCHRPGSIAPMSLRTFAEARPWARSIKARVETRSMPPWHIDKTVGIQEFKNDRSLSDDEIATIVNWVEAGAPEGDPKDMPPLKTWRDGQIWGYASLLGEPDLIVRSTPWTQKKGANDTWWKPVVPSGVTEPRWVRAIEVRPGTIKGRKITHHANSDLLQNEPGEVTQAGPGRFMEWAVGKDGEIMRPNSGKLLLPGSRIAWDIHYSAVQDEDVTDFVEMAVYFYPKGQEPKYRQHLLRMGNTGDGAIDLPPNTIKATETYYPLRQAARIESFQPHMHLRGKAMSLEAILPTGQTVVLSHVDNFTFNWHNSYVYADNAAPLLPKGTIMKVTAWHDNTVANKSNPDPNVWVGYGDRTVDEMGHAWVNVTYLTDDEYVSEVEARRTQLTRGTQ